MRAESLRRWILFAGLALELFLLALSVNSLREPSQTAAVALYLGASLVYLIPVTVLVSGGAPANRRGVLLAAVLFRLTAVWMGPVFTNDLYRYRWEGQLQLAGGNPYQERPGDARWSGLRDDLYDRVDGKDFKAVYGPLVEHLQREMARLSSSPAMQKAPAVLADVLLLLLLARWYGAPAVLLYGWCPLTIVEFAGMGHNDALLVLFLTLAIRFRSGAALGLAIAAKWWPALLLPAFVREKKAAALGVLIPVALFLPYLSDIRENADFVSGFLGGWSNNPSLFWIIEVVTPSRRAAKWAVMVLVGAVALVPFRRLEQSVLATTLAILLLSANVHPWYLTWLMPNWAVLTAPPLACWVALTPLHYWGLVEGQRAGRWLERGPWNAIVYGISAAVFAVWLAGRRPFRQE